MVPGIEGYLPVTAHERLCWVVMVAFPFYHSLGSLCCWPYDISTRSSQGMKSQHTWSNSFAGTSPLPLDVALLFFSFLMRSMHVHVFQTTQW